VAPDIRLVASPRRARWLSLAGDRRKARRWCHRPRQFLRYLAVPARGICGSIRRL